MNIFLDLTSGIAGDMFVAACLDLGADQSQLEQALNSLDLPPWHMVVTETTRGGLRGKHLQFQFQPEHHHRHLSTILQLIKQSQLSAAVQRRAESIFTLLAKAEAHVHGVDVQQVHFHEVGALDAILDVCAAAWCLEHLSVGQVYASALRVGQGMVRCAHGHMSVPVPAVTQMIQQHAIPVLPMDDEKLQGELATPTGVAILAHLKGEYGGNPLSRFDHEGAGLGSREFSSHANRLRILAMVNQEKQRDLQQESVTVLVAHIDDMDPQWQGPLYGLLLSAGALDVSIAPAMMKKNRLGARMEVLCHPQNQEELARLLLMHTTTLGVRYETTQRWVLSRKLVAYETPWGPLSVKWVDAVPRLEHDDLYHIAQKQGWGLPHAQWQIMQWLSAHLNGVKMS
ncbi:nickel pincer cofactor biosynthesis protein LarC [Magnetococcus sp. PR-3]|uniref:nickel pincer cofactor biosynthesis protein LarC n=1 Tax=Magnetococcus sp. PR-3 TaxID=3120355 RepID=UPI002FCE1516